METCTEECLLHEYELGTPETKVQLNHEQHFANQSEQAILLYSPIRDWQTRILALHPGSLGQPLEADLLVSDLIFDDGIVLHDQQSKVQYDALSYCWGEPSFDTSITVKGVIYLITKNLYCALQRLRYPDENVRYLWVDALSIDQHDLEERSMQVTNMLLIFQKAQEIIVWLGENGQHTRAASICLPQSNSLYPFETIIKRLCQRHVHFFLEGLYDLLTRPWHSRLWVKQEVWAARKISVLCGSHSFSWDVLSSFAEQLARDELPHQLLPKYRNPFLGFARASARDRIIRASHGLNGQILDDDMDLINTLYRVSGSQCSDARDRVYGVLGMTIADRKSPFLTVDYTISVSQVFGNIIRYFLERDQNFSVLYRLLSIMDEGGQPGVTFGGEVNGELLPSWCPNLTLPFERFDIFQRFLGEDEPLIPAWPHTRPRFGMLHNYSETLPQTLRTEGFRLAKITSTEGTADARVNLLATSLLDPRKYHERHDPSLHRTQKTSRGYCEDCVSAAEPSLPYLLPYDFIGRAAQPGDIVVAVDRSHSHLVLRGLNERSEWLLVGMVSSPTGVSSAEETQWRLDKHQEEGRPEVFDLV